MRELLEFVVHHGYALVFFWVLAEQGALPVPSAPLLLACGALARTGRLNPLLVVLCGVSACMIADNVWFQLGRQRGSRVLRFLCQIALEPDSCVRRTENAFVRYGARSLLVAKFVPGLNAVAAPLAGVSGVSRVRFLLFDTCGSVLWVLAYAAVGYVFSDQLEDVAAYAARMGSWITVLVVLLFGGWIAWKFIQRRRFLRKLTVARITVEELRKKIEAGEDIIVVDLRNSIDGMADGIPGALRIPVEDLDSRFQDIPRDRDIILYCS